MTQFDDILTPEEVRKIFKCSQPLIYKMARQGRIPHFRIPCPGDGARKKNLIRFKKADVLAFLDEHYQPRT